VRIEAQRDREWLLWISRFRFVTADGLALRFGVSVQQARARLRRLEDAQLIGLHRDHLSESKAAVLTSRGRALLGQDRRVRPPRVSVHRKHELAIVDFIAHVEIAMSHVVGVEILTERDCRRRQAEDDGQRFSVGVMDDRGRATDRWPDIVIVAPSGDRTAIELEFSPKGTDRLQRILRGYLSSSLSEVRFLVESASLGRRLTRIVDAERATMLDGVDGDLCRVVVDAWDGASPEEVAKIRRDSGILPHAAL
jgi:hypothetical protein